jgi:hypothetical protein
LSGLKILTNRCGKTITRGTIYAGFISIVEIGFSQGPQKLNDRSGKMNYPGTIDGGFTVHGVISQKMALFITTAVRT